MHQSIEIVVLFIIAICFAILHIYLPNFFKKIESKVLFSASFGGGLAIAYVFIQLLPELDNTRIIPKRLEDAGISKTINDDILGRRLMI